MAKILIVDDDLGLQKILGISLQKYTDDFEVLFADNGKEAVGILERHSINLLMTDIKMPRMDGLALLSHMSVSYPTIPCIVLTSYTIPGLKKKLSRKILHFLEKPVDPAALAGLIMEGLEQADKNRAFGSVSVPGLMQIIEAEEKTCLLAIHADGKEQGIMYFHDGVLYDAVCGKLKGEQAALTLIGLDDTQIDYRKLPGEKIFRQIETEMQALILEAMRLKDEVAVVTTDPKQTSLQQQEKLLEKGIRLCEGLHLKKAQRCFLEVASQDPDNVQALLWLSRTVSHMRHLRVTLTKAYKLEPKHPDVIRDIRMYSAAAKMGLEQIRRCPFCYAPTDIKAADCHFCKASLVVNAEILSKIGEKADRRVLRVALKRFERVLARELNIPALFNASLACLHLGDFDAALEYLEQLQQCVDPKESAYTAIVERIVEFIASRQARDEIEIPLRKQEAETAVLEGVSQQKKVLVVEDSPTTRKVIKMTLQSNGFQVVEAADGVEALSKINDEQPDLILLDVMLPKLDGYGILSVLKQNSELKAVPVIMLTSKDGLKDRIKGRFSSASAYLTKPFKPEKLIKQVNKFIR